jgi:hypothetical protein
VGWWIVAGAVAVGLVTAFGLRTRLRYAAVFLLLMAAGAGVAWGGMLLRPDPSAGEVVAAVVLLAVLVPFHARIVLGPFGPRTGG